MPRPRKYPQELIDRGVRLAIESGRPVARVAAEIGLPAETLRKRVRQAEADQGLRPNCGASLARDVEGHADRGWRIDEEPNG